MGFWKGRKHYGEKEHMLVTSIFSFSHDVFNGLLFNPFPNKPWLLCVCSTSLLKTLREKEKLLVTSNFSFSHSIVYLFGELSAIFNKPEIVVCKLFQFGRVQNLSFGKGLRVLNSRDFVIELMHILCEIIDRLVCYTAFTIILYMAEKQAEFPNRL